MKQDSALVKRLWLTARVVLPLLLLAMSGVAVIAQEATESPRPALRIGATQLFLSNQHLDPNENYQVIRAFVPTGTTNANCFVTLGDTSFVQLGTLVFCAPRNPIFGEGVMVSVFYPAPPPPRLVLTLTLYQEGAKKYGPPVLCTAADGC